MANTKLCPVYGMKRFSGLIDCTLPVGLGEISFVYIKCVRSKYSAVQVRLRKNNNRFFQCQDAKTARTYTCVRFSMLSI